MGASGARRYFGGGIRRHPDGGVHRAAFDHREIAQDGSSPPGLRRAGAIDQDSRSRGGIPDGHFSGGPPLDGYGASVVRGRQIVITITLFVVSLTNRRSVVFVPNRIQGKSVS